MKAMKQIVVAVGLVVISAVAAVVEAQQGVEKAAPGTLVAPADALNSPVKMSESQMISLVKALPADKYGFAPSAAIFAPGQQTEYAGFEKVEVETLTAEFSRSQPTLGLSIFEKAFPFSPPKRTPSKRIS